uniref:GPS domain-containing protein n=2 Tax=Caenorhabditis japonica TaxID=281687 RepID=A0A8R1DJ35_CAEJA
MRLLLLFLPLLLCLKIAAQATKATQAQTQFTVTLKEQKSEEDEVDGEYLVLTATLQCLADQCNANVVLDNKAVGCIGNSCTATFNRHQTSNISVIKSGYRLDIFDFQYDTEPNIVVLNCEGGLYPEQGCSTLSSTNLGLFDVVCVCAATTKPPYCNEETSEGRCNVGAVKWWVTDAGLEGTSTSTQTTALSTLSTTPDNFQIAASISLSEEKVNKNDEHQIMINASLQCDSEECTYRVVTSSYPDDYYYSINIDGCYQSPCNGNFKKGFQVPLTVSRLNQHLELVTFEFEQIVVLGCDSGLLKPGKCFNTIKSNMVDGVYYNDVLCSCQGGVCGDKTLTGVCLEGEVTWWVDDATPTITTSLPPQNFDFDFSIMLTEENESDTDEDSQQNVIVTTFMNCSTIACQYLISISSTTHSLKLYSVNANEEDCSQSACSGTFYRFDTLPVTVYRSGEILDMFDLDYNLAEPIVTVLGCMSGLLRDGQCQAVDYFDPNAQLNDTLCICQSAPMICDINTPRGKCGNEAVPVWWQQTEYSFNIFLTESKNQEGSPYGVSLSTIMTCSKTSCTYQIKVVKDDNSKEYYSVSVDENSCDADCYSSFLKDETVKVTIYKQGEYLDIFNMKYGEVEVLGCSKGLLVQSKCLSIENQQEDGSTDQVCSCEGNSDGCGQSSQVGECEFGTGTPVWWQPVPTSSTLPSTSTTPSTVEHYFTVTLIEQSEHQRAAHNVTVATSVQCSSIICSYVFDIYNRDSSYYTVLINDNVCPSPCKGNITKGEDSVLLNVHRLGQHLNLVELKFFTDPEVFVLGCANIQDADITYDEPSKCVRFRNVSYVGVEYLRDDVCACNDFASTCDENSPNGICEEGSVYWWQEDPTSSPPTTTTSLSTTTEYDQQNQFSIIVSLTEKLSSSQGLEAQEKKLVVSATMSCSPSGCEYSMHISNSAPTDFNVLVDNQVCSKEQCDGSFLQGKSVNVTVYRGDQHVDLLDFEYTDAPRVVVLGCEEGLVEYQKCVKIRESGNYEGDEFINQVCSCRSAELDCQDDSAENGVCTSGSPKWWQNNAYTSTTSTRMPPTTTDSIPSLKDLSDSGVGINNVTQVLNDTYTYSVQGSSLNRTQIFDITKILHNSANVPGISAENAHQILKNMDECLNAHEDEIRGSQSKEYRLLDVLRPMVQNNRDKIIRYLKGTNLGFGAKKIDCSNIDSDDGLIDYGADAGFRFLNDTNKLSATKRNSIIVPLKNVCGDQDVSHVFFTIYRHQKLFNGPQRYRVYGREDDGSNEEEQGVENTTDTVIPLAPLGKCETQISIPSQAAVLSATVMSQDGTVRAMTKGAHSPVIAKVQFNLGKTKRPLHGKNIVSWFHTGYQKWALDEQCTVTSDEDGIITANCEHLTDFSALILGQINANYVCSYPLIVLGYVVNAASMLCLLMLITIGILFYFRSDLIIKILTFVRGQVPVSGDVINLTYYSIILVFFILLLFFMDQSDEKSESGTTTTYCVVIAAVSYFSLISAILLSMIIGIRMISHFLTPKLRTFFGVMTSPPAAISIGLGVPLIFTVLLAIFDVEFFKRDDQFCWVRPDFVTYAVFIPILLPIINGVICSSFAVYKMFFQAKRGLADKATSHHDAEFWPKVLGLVIMQVAMGLPWGVEFIMIGVSGPSPWNYIFVILIGSQGIDLFLIFLYRRRRLLADSKKWSRRGHQDRAESVEEKRQTFTSF